MNFRFPLRWASFCMGCSLKAWLLMLYRGRFRVSWRRLHIAAIVTLCSLGNSIAGILQNVLFYAVAAQQRVPANPIFIVGHPRTGTTFLHTLLSMHHDVI